MNGKSASYMLAVFLHESHDQRREQRLMKDSPSCYCSSRKLNIFSLSTITSLDMNFIQYLKEYVLQKDDKVHR